MERKGEFMIKKILLIAVAIAMPVGILSASGGIAGAKGKPVFDGNATNYTVSCKDLTGTVSFSPKLTLAGYTNGTAVQTHVTGSFSKCKQGAASKADGKVAISGGTFNGTLTGAPGTPAAPSGQCTSLEGNTTEPPGSSLSVTWTGSPAITSGPSVENILQVTGGSYTGKKSVVYGQFKISGALPNSSSGSFQGTDSGHSSLTQAATTQSESVLASECAGGGITSLGITSEKHVPVFLG
jgi:hypothetical protein